jgi:hypothetical protein
MSFLYKIKDHPVIITLYVLGAVASIISLLYLFQPSNSQVTTNHNSTINSEHTQQVVDAIDAKFDSSNVWQGVFYENIEPNQVHTGTISPGQKNEYFFYVNDSQVYEIRLHTFDFYGQLQIKYCKGDVIKRIVAEHGEKYVNCLFAPKPGTQYLICVNGQTKNSAGSYKLVAVQSSQ